MTDRRRNSLILLIVLGLIAASVAVIATKKTRLGLDLKGGVELVYQGKPTAQSKVDSESLNRAIDIMRKRVDSIGVAQPEIHLSGEKEIAVALPEAGDPRKAEREVGRTAQLHFYDWEPNVIGPDGQPAPSEANVTGGREAASSTFGLTQYQAVLRGAETGADPAQLRHDLDAGLHRRADQRLRVRQLVPDRHEERKDALPRREAARLLRARGNRKSPLLAAPRSRPERSRRPCGVNPGTVILQARPTESAAGKVLIKEPNSFYVLNDRPGPVGQRHHAPPAGLRRRRGGQRPAERQLRLHRRTARASFENVTKNIAHRGQEAQLPGVTKEAAQQHFAVALDGQIITAPSIDYTRYPEGIDSSQGSEISGGFTITSAQELAEELQSGALPIRLSLISRSQVSATLGKQALNQGLVAGLAGFLVVCMFLIVFYRVLGLIAVGGLLIYGIYFFAPDQADPDHADAARASPA